MQQVITFVGILIIQIVASANLQRHATYPQTGGIANGYHGVVNDRNYPGGNTNVLHFPGPNGWNHPVPASGYQVAQTDGAIGFQSSNGVIGPVGGSGQQPPFYNGGSSGYSSSSHYPQTAQNDAAIGFQSSGGHIGQVGSFIGPYPYSH